MSQNSKTCNKCNKIFKTDYLLNKHVNRTVSCDIILQCERCKKLFSTNYQLKMHINRKTLCDILTIKLSDKIALLNIKEKVELKILDKKLLNKQQLARDAELALEKKTSEAAAQDLAKIAARQKLQDGKIAAAFKLQEMKDASKRNTAKILNDRAELEKQRTALNKKAEDELEYEIMYKIAYKASKYTTNFFNDDGLDRIFRELCAGLKQQDCIDIFTKSETCADIVHAMLKDILTHSDPKNKFLFYNSRISMFCAVTEEVINNTHHVVLVQQTYEQVFDTLYPVIEYVYNRYNGGEIGLYDHKSDAIMAKNDVSRKFARFSDERKTFTELVAHNKSQLTVVKQTVDKPVQTSVKILSHNIQTTITDNTNIY